MIDSKSSLKKYKESELNKILNEEKKSLLKDPLILDLIRNKLQIPEDSIDTCIAALLDYKADFEYCEHCPGLEACNKDYPRLQLKLEKTGDLITRHYDPCTKAKMRDSFKDRYFICSFPQEWSNIGIKEIDRSAVRKPILKLMALIKMNKNDSEKNWIYLYGGARVGKSYLLAAFANEITKTLGRGCFCDTSKLIEYLKELSIKDLPKFQEYIDILSTCPILVLDNFGNEFITEYMYSGVVLPVLSERRNKKLITCFASSFDKDRLISLYQSKIGVGRAQQLSRILSKANVEYFNVSGVKVY